MKKLILASLFVGIAPVAFAAAVPCAPIFDASTYNVGGGCTAGNLLFNNFSLTPYGTFFGTSGPVSIVAITVAAGNVSFDTNPNQGSNGGNQQAHLTFTVSGLDPSALIIGASNQNGGNGRTSIRQVVCATAITLATGFCTAPLQDVTNAGGTATPTNSFAGVSSVNVWRDMITPQGTTITGTSFDFQATPEPVAFVLMGTGLCALALVRNRRKNKI